MMTVCTAINAKMVFVWMSCL